MMKKVLISFSALTLLTVSAVSNSAAPVVDGQDIRAIQAQDTSQQSRLIAELVLQINQLQNEVRQLRGQIEEQDYRLQRLTQQQKDMYLDIDRRLSNQTPVSDELGDGADGTNLDGTVVDGDESAIASNGNTPSSNSTGLAQVSEAQSLYNSAFANLKDRNFSAAKDGFTQVIAQYPDDGLVSNAHYWLGQIYYNEEQLDLAEQHFEVVHAEHPNSQKVDASLLKIAQIHEKRGDKTAAKATYQKIAEQFPNTTAGKLAKAKMATL